MRTLLAAAACGVLFLGVVWAGNKVFASDSLAGATPARTTLPTTTEEDLAVANPREKSGGQKKVGRWAHDPLVRHIHADMVSARKAVLHASDLEAEWEPARLPSDGGPRRQNNPDLSRFTITGEGRTIFKSPAGIARTESRVRLFANEGQAAQYFQALNNRAKLHCIQASLKRWLRGNGWKPRLLYARLERDPPIGTQTAMYLLNYAITLSDGTKLEYPLDVLTFQVHRAVGTLQYDFVFSPDGYKPCPCELGEANLVASRLYRT